MAGRSGPTPAMRAVAESGAVDAVDRQLPTPLYHQIYLVLRDKICGGHWPEHKRLPSEAELTSLFGVSRITIRRALNELAADGLIVRRRATGTRVRAGPATWPIRVCVDGVLASLDAMGRYSDVTLLAAETVAAPERIRLALGLGPTDMVQRAVRVRSMDGRPFSHLVTFVPQAIAASYRPEDLASTPMLTLLDRAGVVVDAARQAITATLADPPLAKALNVRVGAALLRLDRTVFDQQGRGVEYLIARYRPDRYQLWMDMSRTGDGAGTTWSPLPAAPAAGPQSCDSEHTNQGERP